MSFCVIFDKKGHVCPSSKATHPSDRWESLFIYSFICKFTNLRDKIEGLDTPMDLENALLSREPNTILSQVLTHFILNLRPQTRNLSTDQISTTMATVLSEYFKSSERTVFWDDNVKVNVDPFEGLEGGFFAADWDFKLKILRQLVELQLCHAPEIKNTIDRAWGVSQNKHKKKDASNAPPDSTDPKSQEKLQLVPVGQDSRRKRFWFADDSPRVYVSTNPWKITATFQSVSSTREEYLALIQELKTSAPGELKKGERRTRLEHAHNALIAALEGRMETIDAELLRVQKVRKKIEQRRLVLAQAEVRETRTRRRTQKPDYVYNNDFDSEDDADEYTYQEEDGHDDEFDDDDFLNFRTDVPNGSKKRRISSSTGTRRSSRATAQNANTKREGSSDSWSNWRGERRSTRLGASTDTQPGIEPPMKRARTEDSTVSTGSVDVPSTAANSAPDGVTNGVKVKSSGAAALKPTEIALEQIAGKKRSKFWVYAVEPIPAPAPPIPQLNTVEASSSNGASSIDGNAGHRDDYFTPSPSHQGSENSMIYDKSLEGSLSPLDSA